VEQGRIEPGRADLAEHELSVEEELWQDAESTDHS
jgi:hypothetical protein